ncbi:MAG: type II toxin-antitoxin system RelE/ParE family toxin [Rhizobiaceae bacterium]
MAWEIELSLVAEKKLEKLGAEPARRILTFLFERLASLENPRDTGGALTGSRLGDLWRYRVGDYRIICDIQDNVVKILVVNVGHRSDVYN